MASRTAINKVKIEKARLSGVPIDPTVTVYQGDAMEWDNSNKVAIAAVPSSTAFIGISETTNPIETAGSPSLLGNQTNKFINVIQQGLVDMLADEAATLQPFQAVRIGNTSQQHVSSVTVTNGNKVGFVDPKWAVGGKAVVKGDAVPVWIQVRPLYSAQGAAAATLA